LEIVRGGWHPPKAGDKTALPGGKSETWETIAAGKDDWLNHRALLGGYAYFNVPSDADKVMILEASGHQMVYVNGEPRAGDLYGNGYVRLPVRLHKGDNSFLFHGGRGRLRAALVKPKADVMFNRDDVLFPDPVTFVKEESLAAVVVMNACREPAVKVRIETWINGVQAGDGSPVPLMPALSVRKVGFPWRDPVLRDPVFPAGEKLKIELKLINDGRLVDTLLFDQQTRGPDQSHQRTFISGIDGSVQYYAVNPARPINKDGPRPALFLTLHGASVEATGQANAYAAKSWGHLVAPTNRRPFGFDWEDWGRLDAMEVLDLAQKELHTDPQRTYLTGHSMGGHGVWHLGATYPSRFAAIGPSAGWATFWTYGAGRPEPASPIQDLLHRAANPSDTFALARNYAQHGVYILHGDADDNVPVGQARMMKKHLDAFHHDLRYHEQPKAGHWWDVSPEPGTDCVDWAPMFDLFARRVIPRPQAVHQVQFTTANPGVSAWCHWVGIEAQTRQLQPSSVDVRCDPGLRRFTGTTGNVVVIAFDLRHLPSGKPVSIDLDGQVIKDIPWSKDPGKRPRIFLRRVDKTWSLVQPSPTWKNAGRYGPFRDVFRNRMLFVYGTRGSATENSWAFAKARYDAETFWYRGNGSIDVIADTDFNAGKEPDRNVIVYGNADTNAAWDALLKSSPVQIKRGVVTIGKHRDQGDDLACLLLRPRPGSDTASVGVVAGTGIAGMRLTDRIPYFVSGVAYPDCIVFESKTLVEGMNGIRAAGYFGLDWSVETGEFAWAK